MNWQAHHKPVFRVVDAHVIVNVLEEAAERIEVDSVEDREVANQVRRLAKPTVSATRAQASVLSKVCIVLFELLLDIIKGNDQNLFIRVFTERVDQDLPSEGLSRGLVTDEHVGLRDAQELKHPV